MQIRDLIFKKLVLQVIHAFRGEKPVVRLPGKDEAVDFLFDQGRKLADFLELGNPLGNHAFQNLRRDENLGLVNFAYRLVLFVAFFNNLHLEEVKLFDGVKHADVGARNHDAVGLLDDRVDVLDLGVKLGRLPLRGSAALSKF